jgi:hypothetical protein
LEPQPLVGWRSGLAPLWSREWRRWWRLPNVLSSALLWLLLGYGFNLLTMVGSRINGEVEAELAREIGLRDVNDMLLLGSFLLVQLLPPILMLAATPIAAFLGAITLLVIAALCFLVALLRFGGMELH